MIDDRTAVYIQTTHRAFEDLRQVSAQLAGMLVLEAASERRIVPDRGPLAPARALFREAAGVIRAASAPERAREHHSDMVCAIEWLTLALANAEQSTGEVDEILVPLRQAYAALQAASRTLPGFEMIDLGQGCCAPGRVA